MADTLLNDFVAQGTTAQRLAFIPSPPTPASGPTPGYAWWDTTLQAWFSYVGGAWVSQGGGRSKVQVKSVAAATYTLTDADAYFYILFTNAAGCVVTVPTDVAAGWTLGIVKPVFALEQAGAGAVQVQGDVGVTVNTLPVFQPVSFGQHAVLQLIETGANIWTLFGAQLPA